MYSGEADRRKGGYGQRDGGVGGVEAREDGGKAG